MPPLPPRYKSPVSKRVRVPGVRAAAPGDVGGSSAARPAASTGTGGGTDRAAELILSFVVPGAPRTKKNSGKVLKMGGKKLHVSSDAHQAWHSFAQTALPRVRRAAGNAGIALPIAVPVNCAAVFYRHANVGDAVGFYQAIADWLENVGILVNDRQIVQWDGSRLAKDPDNPRIEVCLSEIDGPGRRKQ